MAKTGPNARRILYFMHVDWRWIKQRPHFIAEHLSELNKLLVLYRPIAARKHRVPNPSAVSRITLLPVPRRFGIFFERLDAFLQAVWISVIALLFRPDILWIPFPTIYKYLPEHLKRLPIVYDCMDDALGFFPKDTAKAERVRQLEAELIGRAAMIICSSRHLGELLKTRYGAGLRYQLVRNGLPPEFLKQSSVGAVAKSDFLEIGYVGTISDWFDFEAIAWGLSRAEFLRFHLIGPVNRIQPPKSDRLLFHGVVSHEELRAYTQRFDVLIMPFVRGPLVESVDPVKLYEYLAFGKEVVSVFYPEIARFEPYVHFYHTKEELLDILKGLASGTLAFKNRPEVTLAFLSDNTWKERVNAIQEAMNNLPAARVTAL